MSDIQTRRYYNTNAKKWVATKTNSFFLERQFRLFIEQLPRPGKVLDIGCAGGIHVPLFLGIGRKLKYEGVDISASMIRIARRRYPQLQFSVGDVSSHKFHTKRKGKCVGIFASAVLMHVPKDTWEKLLVNLEKILHEKGIMYFSVPTERFADDGSRHLSIFSPQEIRAVLSRRGWKILKHGAFGTQNGKWVWFIVRNNNL